MISKTYSVKIIVLFSVIFGISFTINSVFATKPDYHGHKWFLGETDVRYGSFSEMNIGQEVSYAALDSARNEINSASEYHMDRVTSFSTNWIATTGWGDINKLGQEYHHHNGFGYSDGTDIEFNHNAVWTTGTATNLRAVAIHEMFHALDFDHVSGTDSVMLWYYDYSSYGQI